MADYKYYPESDSLIKTSSLIEAAIPDGGNAAGEITKPGGIKMIIMNSLFVIAIGLVLLILMFGAPFAIAMGQFLLSPVGPVSVWAQIGIGALMLIIIFRIIKRK